MKFIANVLFWGGLFMFVAGVVTGAYDIYEGRHQTSECHDEWYGTSCGAEKHEPVSLWIVGGLLIGGAVVFIVGCCIEDSATAEECSVCHVNRTHRQNASGKYVCADCDLKQRMAAEPRYNCPVHYSMPMTKEVVEHELIIDRCPNCKGVFLSAEELDRWKQMIEKEASSSGSSGGSFATGLAVGMVIG